MKLDFSDVACGLSRKEVVPLTPVRWRSDLSQAAKFHARAMAESQGSCYQRDTCPAQCALFGGTCDFRARISVFHECGDDDIVFQVIGQGDLDNVLVGTRTGGGVDAAKEGELMQRLPARFPSACAAGMGTRLRVMHIPHVTRRPDHRCRAAHG